MEAAHVLPAAAHLVQDQAPANSTLRDVAPALATGRWRACPGPLDVTVK